MSEMKPGLIISVCGLILCLTAVIGVCQPAKGQSAAALGFAVVQPPPTPAQILSELQSSLKALSADMDDFRFEKVHPHLRKIYGLYDAIRAVSVLYIERRKQFVLDSLHASEPAYVSLHGDPVLTSGAPIPDTMGTENALQLRLKQAIPVIPTTDGILKFLISGSASDGGGDGGVDASQVSVYQRQVGAGGVDDGKIGLDIAQDQGGASGTRTFRLKVVVDSTIIVWEMTFNRTSSLEGKTKQVHRYFDNGEIEVSSSDLEWLKADAKKLENEFSAVIAKFDTAGRNSAGAKVPVGGKRK